FLTGKKLETGGQVTYTGSSKDVKGKMTETHHNLYCLVKHYAPDEAGEFARGGAIGHLTLLYGVQMVGKNKGKHSIDIPLVITQPNYGGQRWWFLAPCCGR